jgi:serine/threonine protein kinase
VFRFEEVASQQEKHARKLVGDYSMMGKTLGRWVRHPNLSSDATLMQPIPAVRPVPSISPRRRSRDDRWLARLSIWYVLAFHSFRVVPFHLLFLQRHASVPPSQAAAIAITRTRLQSEIRLLRRLNHPNVIKLLDVEEREGKT